MTNPEIDEYGNRCWYNKQRQYCRTDGPAIEWVDGTKCWYVNGLLHRLNGPAVEFANGYKRWYIEGKEYTEEEFTLLAFVYNNV